MKPEDKIPHMLYVANELEQTDTPKLATASEYTLVLYDEGQDRLKVCGDFTRRLARSVGISLIKGLPGLEDK